MESVEIDVDEGGEVTTTEKVTLLTKIECEQASFVEKNSEKNNDEISEVIPRNMERDSNLVELSPTNIESVASTSNAKIADEDFCTLQPKVYVPSTEEDIHLENHKDYLDRYFTQRYCIDINQKFNDHCVLIHSNKVCVITLAPSHPLISRDIKIEKINFQVSQNVNRLNNKVSGKRKRNAQNLNQTSPLCFVECANGETYTIYSVVPGKLLEMNENLENEPEKIRECSPEFYHKQCYVAIILPNIRHTVDTLNKNFLTPEEYKNAIKEREERKNSD